MISDRYDVQVSWTQFDVDNDDFATSCANCEPFTSNSFLLVDLLEGHSSSEERLNTQAFDGTLGQYHKLGENLMARIFAGVRYAKITSDTTNIYAAPFPGTTFIDNYTSNFSGWGPELGFDVNYDVYEWFGIVGHFAAAFLIGELDSDSNVFGGCSTNNGNCLVDSESEARMVPALDAKLGLNLGVPFMDMQDRFIIEAGYQVAYYLNVVDQIQSTVFSVPGTGITHNYVDVGLMGPYANLGVRF